MVRGCNANEVVYLLCAPEEAHVVPGHHATLAVTYEIDLFRVGGCKDCVDEIAEFGCGICDRPGGVYTVGRAIVQREDAVSRVGEERGKHGPVLRHALKGPGYQNDGIRMFGAGFTGPVVRAWRGDVQCVGRCGLHTNK
jgi:hypothetical protein